MDKKNSRLVVDTNVIISGLISVKGGPAQILKAIRNKKAILLVSDPVIQEYLEVLEYPKIQKYNKMSAEYLRDLSAFFLTHTERVELLLDIKGSRDPDDNKFLSTAVNGKATMIVSGDNDLLSLKEIRGIPILQVTDALNQLRL